MLKLYTSSNVPIELKIDGQKYIGEKLTIGDYSDLSVIILESRKNELKNQYKEKKEGSEKGIDCINECNKLIAPSPYELIPILLDSYHGLSLVLYTCLHKKQPEITFDWVSSLYMTDDLIQFVYDLMDIRRKLVEVDSKKKEETKKEDTKEDTEKKKI